MLFAEERENSYTCKHLTHFTLVLIGKYITTASFSKGFGSVSVGSQNGWCCGGEDRVDSNCCGFSTGGGKGDSVF